MLFIHLRNIFILIKRAELSWTSTARRATRSRKSISQRRNFVARMNETFGTPIDGEFSRSEFLCSSVRNLPSSHRTKGSPIRFELVREPGHVTRRGVARRGVSFQGSGYQESTLKRRERSVRLSVWVSKAARRRRPESGIIGRVRRSV